MKTVRIEFDIAPGSGQPLLPGATIDLHRRGQPTGTYLVVTVGADWAELLPMGATGQAEPRA